MNVNAGAVDAALGLPPAAANGPPPAAHGPPHPHRDTYLDKEDVRQIYKERVLTVIKHPSMESFTEAERYKVQVRLLNLYLPGHTTLLMQPWDYNLAIQWGGKAITDKLGTIHTKMIKRCDSELLVYSFLRSFSFCVCTNSA